MAIATIATIVATIVAPIATNIAPIAIPVPADTKKQSRIIQEVQ